MKQYVYEVTSGNRTEHVRCTAPLEEYARAQVASYYPGAARLIDERPPHQTFGEIDASSMTAADYQFLKG